MKVKTLRCIPLSELVNRFPALENLADSDPSFTWGDCDYSLIHKNRLKLALEDVDGFDDVEIGELMELLDNWPESEPSSNTTECWHDGIVYIDLEN